jgi:dipeptidyl-peptidase-4
VTDGRDSFPRQSARTRRFTLGLPRSFTVAPDGSRVVFLRSGGGEDPVTGLWVFDVEERRERAVADPRAIGAEEADVPAEERARRERAREHAEGVVGYSTDRETTVAAFALAGGLYLADLRGGEVRRLPATEPTFDPRIDPTGRRIGYVSGRALRVIEADGTEDRLLAGDEADGVSWGVAEFVAAEEMERLRGFWWSPDGDRIAAARVDESPVQVWHISDPADPGAEPASVRYPAAGTVNAGVTLHVLGLDGSRVDVDWDRTRFEYLARVVWTEGAPLTIQIQARDQQTARILEVADDGSTTLLREDRDEAWIDLVAGSPDRLTDGRLVSTADEDGARRLLVGGDAVTPATLQVRDIAHVDDGVLFTGSDEPETVHVWRWTAGGGLDRLTEEPGIHAAAGGGDVVVIASSTVDRAPETTVWRGGERLATVTSHAAEPVLDPRPSFFAAGRRELRSALLLPGGHEPTGPLPVLLDPYGGPHFQRVTRSRGQYLESQWFADQGFAVLVVDGRGTPGRGPAWDRAIHLDVLATVLQDQVDALHAAADRFGFLDLSRVAIRGWSFGGELAAAAVLRRPDVFHAAVAGAPVTDQRLYDTHYTERYLGHPDREPEVFRRNSLLGDAPNLSRPMLIVHGLADDNVVVANSLRLSRALMEAGRPHTFLPLPGITHMAAAEAVAENLLLLELRFLRDALALD